MEENTDEVVPFVERLLQTLKNTNASDDAFCTVWRYFLSQTRSIRWILQKRLKREVWPEVYEGIDGRRQLHITVGGACPAACLMGFLVWLAESNHFNCQITCSTANLTPGDVVNTVADSLRESGWVLNVLPAKDHQMDLESTHQSLDMMLVGHPGQRNLVWQESIHLLRENGCLVLLDFPDSTSFSQVLAVREIEYAHPIVFDLLPPGLDIFTELERSAIQSLSLIQTHSESELPVLKKESTATLFVHQAGKYGTTTGSDVMSPVDSWAKSESRKRPRQAKPRDVSRNDVSWRGTWTRINETGAVPPAFAFASLDVCPMDTNAVEGTSRAYYETLRDLDEVSMVELEGMGRPLILRYHNISTDDDV